ncbi:helix-turn-helix domain-containing protein [Micromonospora sp. NPDC047707]|uniref:helix-turn-helix domain-containing protein n=1 Tax=Micromonospora sp. NPDC047707 TaxID=3154498 RepID=UPI0034523C66
MSVRVMTWVWDHSPVGGTERLVLLAIADCAADDGANAWPSLGTLARKARLDERTVRRIIRRLEVGGHLLVEVAAGTPTAPAAAAAAGAALPVRDGQCARHRGQRAGRCGPCRSEELAGGTP